MPYKVIDKYNHMSYIILSFTTCVPESMTKGRVDGIVQFGSGTVPFYSGNTLA
jgi:hypothetical protein